MRLSASRPAVGLFGGSFDPPHLGHVALVRAGVAIGLRRIYVIPALPVHRQLSGRADAETRLAWLQRVFAEDAQVEVVDWEIREGRPTPAIETLRRFRREQPDTTPWLMLGADAWQGLPGWREYPVHRDLCNVAVFARRGADLDTVCGHAGWRALPERPVSEQGAAAHSPGHWLYVAADLPAISATELRRDAQRGLSLVGRVPEAVRRQIEQAYNNSAAAPGNDMEMM